MNDMLENLYFFDEKWLFHKNTYASKAPKHCINVINHQRM